MKDVVKALSDLIDGLRSNLMNSSEEYRLLVALEKTMAELRTEKPKSGERQTVQIPSALQAKIATHAAPSKSLRTSVYEILSESDQPLPIGEILQRLTEKGVVLNSRNPRAALSSNLSQDERFENGFVDGRPMWRLKKEAPQDAEPAAPVRPRPEKAKTR